MAKYNQLTSLPFKGVKFVHCPSLSVFSHHMNVSLSLMMACVLGS